MHLLHKIYYDKGRRMFFLLSTCVQGKRQTGMTVCLNGKNKDTTWTWIGQHTRYTNPNLIEIGAMPDLFKALERKILDDMNK